MSQKTWFIVIGVLAYLWWANQSVSAASSPTAASAGNAGSATSAQLPTTAISGPGNGNASNAVFSTPQQYVAPVSTTPPVSPVGSGNNTSITGYANDPIVVGTPQVFQPSPVTGMGLTAYGTASNNWADVQ